MDRLTEMEAFATVVDQGGFTDAAKKMGISKSAVSKHVSALKRVLAHGFGTGRPDVSARRKSGWRIMIARAVYSTMQARPMRWSRPCSRIRPVFCGSAWQPISV